MSDKRLYPNTVIFQTTDGKGVTYYNARVLEQIRQEIEGLDRYYDNDYFSVNNCPMYKCNEVLQIIDKYR